MSACDCPTCGQRLPDTGTTIDLDAGIIVRDGQFAAFPPAEFALFEKLNERPGRVISKDALMTAVYWLRNDEEVPEHKMIEVLVCKIRKKLTPLGISIENTRARGYRLVYRQEQQA